MLEAVQIAVQLLDVRLDLHHLSGVLVRHRLVGLLAIVIVDRHAQGAEHDAQNRADDRPVLDRVRVDLLLLVRRLNGGRQVREQVALALVLVLVGGQQLGFALIRLDLGAN